MPRVAIREFTIANPIYAGCTADFWTVSGGAKTATHADLYRGATGTSKHANPMTLDSRGMSSGPIYIEAETICTVSGLSVDAHDTGIITPGPTFRVDQTTGKLQYSFDAGSSWNDSGDYIFKHRGTWVTATTYYRNDTSLQGGNLYLCLEGHTAGVFATDLAAGKWLLFVDLSSNVVVTSATAPSTTFAHMLWADTTNGRLKLRNSSNSAWVELHQISNGSAFSWMPKRVSGRYYMLGQADTSSTPVTTILSFDRIYFEPCFVPMETSISAVAIKMLGAHTARTLRFGIYTHDDSTGKPLTLEFSSDEINTGGTSGIKDAALSATLSAGWHWIAILVSTGTLQPIGLAQAVEEIDPLSVVSGLYDPFGIAFIFGSSDPWAGAMVQSWITVGTYSYGALPSTAPSVVNNTSAIPAIAIKAA